MSVGWGDSAFVFIHEKNENFKDESEHSILAVDATCERARESELYARHMLANMRPDRSITFSSVQFVVNNGAVETWFFVRCFSPAFFECAAESKRIFLCYRREKKSGQSEI